MSVFVRVVAPGGFAAAARAADISPTMVAKHVRSLEALLGFAVAEPQHGGSR